MKKLQKSLYIMLFLGLLFPSCRDDEREEAPEETEQAVAVEAQQVEVKSYPQLVSYTANVEAWEEAFITGPTGVRIDEILVDEGDRVQRGQLLATMNPTQLSQARSQMELARREMNRLDTLVDIGAVSGQQFDQARTQYEEARRTYENLAENTRLTANFNGVITDRYFSEGEVFSPSADAPAILTMMQIEPVKVTLNVAERFYNQVNEGMEAIVRTDVYPDREFKGEVHRKFPTIDRASRTFQTEVRIANENRDLRPGMFARVSLDLGEIEGIYVPSTAVVNQPGTTNQMVFVKEGDRVNRVQVETGNRYRDQIRIVSGLEPGDIIITEGIGKLNQGTLVRVVNNGEIQQEQSAL